MARYSGSGWHRQSIRHSNARKYGRAGGKYAIHTAIMKGRIARIKNKNDWEQVAGEILMLARNDKIDKKSLFELAKPLKEKEIDLKKQKHFGSPEVHHLHWIPSPMLESANTLPVQVSIIVPSTKNIKLRNGREKSIKISNKEFHKRIDETKKFFDEAFGGDTTISEVGSYWDASKNELTKEKGAIIESSMSIPTYKRNIEKISKYAEQKQKDYKQDTMLLAVEGRKFITPKKEYIDNDKTTENEPIPVA